VESGTLKVERRSANEKEKHHNASDYNILLTSDICSCRFFCLVTHSNEFSAAPFLRLFIPLCLSVKPKIRKLASLKQSGFITV